MSNSKSTKAETAQTGRVIAKDGLYEKSASQLKVEASIKEYQDKYKKDGVLSPHEARILANNLEKLEDKGASRLFKFCKEYIKNKDNKEMVKIMLGKAKLPTEFNDFVKLLPAKKRLFSKWDAFGVMTQLNKGVLQLVKSKTQEKKQESSLAA